MLVSSLPVNLLFVTFAFHNCALAEFAFVQGICVCVAFATCIFARFSFANFAFALLAHRCVGEPAAKVKNKKQATNQKVAKG